MNDGYLKRGLFLGLSLAVLNKLLAFTVGAELPGLFYAVLYFFVTLPFLSSEKLSHTFLTALISFSSMIAAEIFCGIASLFLSIFRIFDEAFEICAYGAIGYFAAFITALITPNTMLSVKAQEINAVSEKRKGLLTLYGVITAVSFYPFMIHGINGIGFPLFMLVQCVMIGVLLDDKMRILWLLPALVVSLNSLLYFSNMWVVPNVIVCGVLMTAAISDVRFGKPFELLRCVFERFFTAAANMGIFFRGRSVSKAEKGLIARFAIAFAITLPAAIMLIYALAQIDEVFLSIFENITLELIIKIIVRTALSIAVGLFLTALMYTHGMKSTSPRNTIPHTRNVDLLIVNTFLTVIVAIYTLFAVVQFRYLFAGAQLPEGMTYTHYARRGFFELLSLTGVNITMILVIVYFTNNKHGVWRTASKFLLCALCAATLVMLASSFYRMYLYCTDDGLTRMRFMVFGFLIFEAAALIVTGVYCVKPKFSILTVYICTALVYYCILNLAPIDRIVAQSQVNRYFTNQTDNAYYILDSLSPDAVREAAELIKSNDPNVSWSAKRFVDEAYKEVGEKGIFEFSLSDIAVKEEYTSLRGNRSSSNNNSNKNGV